MTAAAEAAAVTDIDDSIKRKLSRCGGCAPDNLMDTVGIGSVKTIFDEHLFMTKVCARWVPGMLQQKMKDCRCETSNESLKLMQSNWNLFMRR